jgi:hypothetical protein
MRRLIAIASPTRAMSSTSRLVHGRRTVHNAPVHRHQIPRPDHEQVAHLDQVHGDVVDGVPALAVCDLGRAGEQRFERAGCATHGVRFERLASRLHQDDDGTSEVLAEREGREDREHRHDVRGEAGAENPG